MLHRNVGVRSEYYYTHKDPEDRSLRSRRCEHFKPYAEIEVVAQQY
jgi:hypothetical protein